MAQQVKDTVLSPLWYWLDPWPGDLSLLLVWPEKKKKRKKKGYKNENFKIKNVHSSKGTKKGVPIVEQ